MVPDHPDHSAFVRVWLEGAARDLTRVQLIALLDQSLSVVWKRADVTLGEVTVAAIGDRILHNASEKYPPAALLYLTAFAINEAVKWRGVIRETVKAQG